MTSDTGHSPLATAIAVVLALPVAMIAVAVPVMVLTGASTPMGGGHGLAVFMPLIPATIFGTLAYVVYTSGTGADTGSAPSRDERTRARAGAAGHSARTSGTEHRRRPTARHQQTAEGADE